MAAIPEANRQDETEPSPPPPFAAPDAGADYFATDAHYSALAGRVISRLREGPGFVLVTGDAPPDPRRLAPALTNSAAGVYAVSVVGCGPELNREHLLRTAPPSGAPLFVFDDADRLSDAQLGSLCEALASSDGAKPAAVLLARPACVARLDRLQPRLSREGLATHFRLNELERDEVEAFIRRQLPADEQAAAFTAEAISAIADFSGGDPATVNRLSRLIANFAQSANGKEAKKPDDGTPNTEEALERQLDIVASARLPAGRRHRGARLLVGTLVCLAITGLALMWGDPAPFLAGWLRPLSDLVRDELAGEKATSEPAPTPLSAPNAAAPVAAPAEPTPPTAETIEAQPVTAPAPTPVAAPAEPKPAAPAAETIEARPITPPAPVPVAAPAEPKPSAATPPAVEPPPPRPSAVETAGLVARGDALVSARDIVSARLYYERATELGDGRGALRMGETFDPVFLERAGMRGTGGDEQEALSWYRRARDLGDAEADRLLKKLEPH